MPQDDAQRPHVEMRLPAELARYESMLAAMPLPETRVQRDALLYRAGWAASAAASRRLADGGRASRVTRFTRARRTFAWSAASAAIAASLAVMITSQIQRQAERPLGAVPSDAVVQSAGQHDAADSPAGMTPVEREALTERREQPIPIRLADGGRLDWNASLLAMRDRALRQQWEDPRLGGRALPEPVSTTPRALSSPKNAREMLQELLPGATSRRTMEPEAQPGRFSWPWSTNRLDETT